MMGTSLDLTPSPPPGKFLNRDRQIEIGTRELKALRQKPTGFKVLEVHGYGGMGKTRLLKRLREIAEAKSPPDHVIWIPLEIDAHAMEIGALLQIRDQLSFECMLFDTALVTFWRATSQRLPLEVSDRWARSLPVQAFQAAGMAAGVPAPISFALEAFDYAKRKLAALDRYSPEEFESIGALCEMPGEIRRRLSDYLGIDIKRGLGRGEELLAFYDGYEKQRLEARTTERWLCELLSNLGRGLHVISTREPLEWDSFEDGAIERVDVENLPRAQSAEMIQARLGKLDELIEERLLEVSRQIPFFLEAVVASCSHLQLAGERLTLESLPSSPDDPVDHLLKHLPEEQRRLIVMLATVQVFDEHVFEHLVRKFRFSSDTPSFDRFIDQFFIEKVTSGLYKTHDLLTKFVRDSKAVQKTRQDALRELTEDLPLRFRSADLANPHTLLTLFSALLSGWYSQEDAPENSIATLVDAGYLLYDAGYWNELASLSTQEDHPVAVVVAFFSALAMRRNEGSKAALDRFATIEDQLLLLGRHARSAELEVAYLTELSGDYAAARRKFSDLQAKVSRFEATNRLHLRLWLYQADMLTMDGEFHKASRLLFETYETKDLSKVDWIEFVRHRGHVFRFSFLFETAEQLYGQALRGAEEIESTPLQGKLWTNLAEAACWHDPDRALEAAERSAELNGRVDNRIELAKCEAARAMAWAKLEEHDRARAALAKAREHAEQVTYPAAAAFSLQAECVLHGLNADMDSLRSTLSALEEATGKLDTYSHLRVAPVWLTRSERDFAAASEPFEWLEPEGLEDRLRSCFGG